MRRIVIIAILSSVVFVKPAHCQERFITYGALATTQILDVTSTYKALGSGYGQEGNGFAAINHPSIIVAEKAAVSGVLIYATEYLRAHGHKRTSRILAWSLISVGSIISVHNFRIASGK